MNNSSSTKRSLDDQNDKDNDGDEDEDEIERLPHMVPWP